MVLERTLLGQQGDQPVNSKENQPWILIGRTAAEAPKLWPPDAKSQLIVKDPDAGADRRQEEKGTTEDEMAGWHHRLDGHEFEWTLGVGDGQGGLACWDSWGRKESDMTERLNWTDWTETCTAHAKMFIIGKKTLWKINFAFYSNISKTFTWKGFPIIYNLFVILWFNVE